MSVGRLPHLLLCLFMIAWVNLAHAVPKRVLILDSFGRDMAPFNTAASACRTTLTLERGDSVYVRPRLLDKAVPRYDWRDLKRWGISESVLPAGSVVSFRQPGFWEKYWGRTLLVLAFVLVQSGLIGGLLVSRRRQRKLETIASLVAELSTRFVNLPAEEVDREIEAAQRRVCECLGVETSGLWQWESAPPHEMILTHLHRPPNGPKAPARISAQEMFPWLLEQALKGKTLDIDTDDIPVTATRDIETRRRYGIKSSVLLPLAVGGQPILGVLTFTSLSAKRTWSPQIVQHLELIAQLFTNALVRKRAEQSLRESELRLGLAAERWRLTVEAMPNGVILVDQAGRIVLVNAQAEKIFGYARQELLGQAIEVLVPERFRDRHPAHRADFAGRHQSRLMGVGREIFGRRKDGTEFPVELGLNPFSTDEGMLVLCAVVDISQRRKMEMETQELRRQLAHTGRVSMLGQLASALAHELSQPLGAILRNAEAAEALLQEPAPDLEELQAIVTDIRNDDRRAGNVIDRLRSLLKRRALDLQSVDVLDLIRQVVTLVHADSVARRIKVEFEAPAQLPLVLGDSVHLQQVLLNLILNGMDAMNGTTTRERCVTIRAHTVEPGWIEVSVSDHGVGFPPEIAARLFEPFFTTKAHGMGMGLPVSKTIIEAHGGTIGAENLPGGGAVFRFRLPVTPSGGKA